MSEDMGAYYRRRAAEERAAAERAESEAAAAIHRSLAERYAALAGEPQSVATDQRHQTAEVVSLRNPAAYMRQKSQ